jgi:hypothetical protein
MAMVGSSQWVSPGKTISSTSAQPRSSLATRRPMASTVLVSETTASLRPIFRGATRSAAPPSSVSSMRIVSNGTSQRLARGGIAPVSRDDLADQAVPVGLAGE